MPETRAVLFDAGGTLFTYDNLAANSRAVAPEYCRAMGLPESAVSRVLDALNAASRKAFLEAEQLPYYSHAEVSLQAAQYAAAMVGATISRSEAQRIRLMRMAIAPVGTLRPGAFDTLAELRRRGFHLGLVSNADEDQLALMLDRFGFGPHFDAILCSETARSCKPDAGIYLQALGQARCTASEAVFVGDTPQHDIVGARAVGMRTVLILEDTPMATRAATTAQTDTGGADHVISELEELLEII